MVGTRKYVKIAIFFNVIGLLMAFSVLPGCGENSSGDTITYVIAPPVTQPPIANFMMNPGWGQASLPVQFMNTSDPGGATINGCLWDFGDGTTSTETSPIHVYVETGVYTVTLTLATSVGYSTRVTTNCIKVMPNDIVAWNNVAMQAMAVNNWMPPHIARGLTMMHGAIYDSVNAVEKKGQVYVADIAAPLGACKYTAAAAAAHRVLTQILPAQAADFDAQLALSMAGIPDGDWKTDGAVLGVAVADAMLAWRTGDGSEVMGMPYAGLLDPGQWRPTPPSYLPGMFTSWRYVTPFAMTSPSQFRPGPPPALDSAQYATDFNEVKTIGAKISATRTMDQGMMATFWVGMAGTIMETGRMNLVVQQAVEANHLNYFDTARLFTLVNIAMADAAIAGLDCKYTYTVWRPVTAIWEAASDNNPATEADPAWESYIVAPAHPEYISTHSALTKSAAVVLESFFGTGQARIVLPSFMDPNVTRTYYSYDSIAEEAGMGRIYGGIHFRFSYDTGSVLGENIGNYVFLNYLLPL